MAAVSDWGRLYEQYAAEWADYEVGHLECMMSATAYRALVDALIDWQAENDWPDVGPYAHGRIEDAREDP